MGELLLKEQHVVTSNGRVHLRFWSGETPDESESPLLILLHPMPHDGGFFTAIAPHLASGRTVVAPDYPGYGGSDPLEGTPTIALYARVILDALTQAGFNGPFDFFGFHTGCLVAVEFALLFPSETRRLVQVDVPYFDPEKREELLASDFAKGGFVAAFSYAGEDRYPLVKHENLVIATASSLLEPSRKAAGAIQSSQLLEFPQVEAPALETGAEIISRSALIFLD